MDDKNLTSNFVFNEKVVESKDRFEMSGKEKYTSLIKDDLTSYSKSIEKLALERSRETFLNSGKDHAAIVMGSIFKYSKEHVRVFAGNFCGEVSSQSVYLDGLKYFIQHGGKVTIILEEYQRANNPALFDLLAISKFFKEDKINVFITDKKVVGANGNKIHFTIGDNSIYRLEEDTENYAARGSFNNESEVKSLLELFDDIQKHSSVVDIN